MPDAQRNYPWFGRGWVESSRALLIPFPRSSPWLHVPVAVATATLAHWAQAGVRLDLEGYLEDDLFVGAVGPE